MPKRRFTEDSWRSDPWFKALNRALRSSRTEEEMADFLRDIGTLSELQAWSERLEVAKQLARGLSYRQVAAQTGASTTTVTRVARFLESGAGGYRRHLKRPQPSENTEPSGLEAVKQRRPGGDSALQKYLHRS